MSPQTNDRAGKVARLRERAARNAPMTFTPHAPAYQVYAVYRVEMTPQGEETSRKRVTRFKNEQRAESDALFRNIAERSDPVYVVIEEDAR